MVDTYEPFDELETIEGKGVDLLSLFASKMESSNINRKTFSQTMYTSTSA